SGPRGPAGDGPPPIATGVAAPMFVAGAIAATWLAITMKVPALAARAPLGPTHAATGTGDARISRTMSRVESASPPGVSMRITTIGAPDSAALARPRATYSALAGPIGPSRRRTGTVAPDDASAAASAAGRRGSALPSCAANDTAAARKAIEATAASAHCRMDPPVSPWGTSPQYSQ